MGSYSETSISATLGSLPNLAISGSVPVNVPGTKVYFNIPTTGISAPVLPLSSSAVSMETGI